MDSTGLTYFGARYYDSKIGRFISPDAVAMFAPAKILNDPQSLNLYAYARNNPMRFVDPDGNMSIVAQRGAEMTPQAWDMLVKTFIIVTTAIGGAVIGLSGDRSVNGSPKVEDGSPKTGPGSTTSGEGPQAIPYQNTTPQATTPITPPPPGNLNNDDERNKGYKDSLSKMEDKSVKSAIKSFKENIAKHEKEIQDALKSGDQKAIQAINHWKIEIQAFKEQLDLAIKEAIKRGLKLE